MNEGHEAGLGRKKSRPFYQLEKKCLAGTRHMALSALPVKIPDFWNPRTAP